MESPVIKFDQMGKINMLLVKVASNLQYREEVQELLLHFTAIEKARKEFLWMPGVCLILLFYIQGEFDEVNKRKTNYKVTKSSSFSLRTFVQITRNILIFSP